METKKPKQTKKDREIAHALSLLKKHNVSVFTLEDEDFTDEWALELWKHNKIAPTKETIKMAKNKAINYIYSEFMETIRDSIEYVGYRAKEHFRIVTTNPKQKYK